MLKIEHLRKVFPDGTEAIKDISVEIKKGEFVIIIGLSGSGKSTLLRCINRLIEPTSGRIRFNDIDITSAPRGQLKHIRQKIGMIFQQFNLIKRSSVLTNVLTGKLSEVSTLPSLLGIFPKKFKEEAMQNIERVGLKGREYSRADKLSGGQQQRVAIARTLMQNPELLLAYEPVASLYPATSHSVMKYLKQINVEDGITVLCNLHFLSLAREYGTRIIALKDGILVFDGSPAEINDDRFREIYGKDAIEVEIR